MDLFETMSEIANNVTYKTDTGDQRMYGVTVGIVTKNYDEAMPGRVCVQILERDKKANELKWARVAQPSAGKGWGHYFLPEEGDEVLLAFEHGIMDRPYIIGCINKANDTFLKKSADEFNQFKRIRTRYGSTIEFEDFVDSESKSGDGSKDKFRIYTNNNEHRITIDNENDEIVLSDKPNKNFIKIRTNSDVGEIVMQCEKKMIIKVGDKISVVMDGTEGKITVKCDKVNFKATEDISVEANGKMNLKSGNAVVEASSTIKVNAGAELKMTGNPVSN